MDDDATSSQPEQIVRKLRHDEHCHDGKDYTEVDGHPEIAESTWKRCRARTTA